MGGELDDRPRAEAWKVQDLVRAALRGRLRVPEFQRSLKWESDDVVHLLDSIYRGYPVGSLLLWRGRPNPPTGPCALGRHVIAEPAQDDLRWLVDGQQRVTALALSLTRHGVGDTRFHIWFDTDHRRFQGVTPRRPPEPGWLPAYELLDPNNLQELLFTWPGSTPDRRRSAIDAGNRLRDYEIPATSSPPRPTRRSARCTAEPTGPVRR